MEDFVPTRGSKLKQDATENFVSMSYEAPKKKVKTEGHANSARDTNVRKPENDKNNDPKRQQELEMKRARYDIMKFGMSGFEKEKAREAKVALAISLGAKPPKNRRVNYKVLKLERQKAKEAAKKNEPISGLNKSLLKHKSKKKSKRDSNGILGVYGKVQKGDFKRKKI